MKSKTFAYPLIIKENHLDTFGHVNNAMYLALLEEARWDFITKNGYGLKKNQMSGLGPTILEVKLCFFKELCLREEIIIETKVLSYEKKISQVYQKIIRHHEICCTAEFVMGLFDLKERKLVLPTKEWLEAMGVSG